MAKKTLIALHISIFQIQSEYWININASKIEGAKEMNGALELPCTQSPLIVCRVATSYSRGAVQRGIS